MRTIQHIVSVTLAAGLFIACGCRTSGPSNPSSSAPSNPAATPAADPNASVPNGSTPAATPSARGAKPSKSSKPPKTTAPKSPLKSAAKVSPSKSSKFGARKTAAPELDPTQIDDRELERRVKAHAAFAAGVVSQIKEDADAGLAIDVARRRLQRLEFDKAIALLQKAAAVPGSSGTVMAYLGLTLKQLDRPAEAIAAYREALRRMPSSLASAGALAELLAEDKKADEAVALLKSMATQTANDPRFWIDLSDLLQQQATRLPARAEEIKTLANEIFARAATTESSDPRVIRRLADRFYELKQMDQAEAMYRRLREVTPRDPFPVARLAEIYLRAGKGKEAAAQLQTLQRESPMDPMPLFYLGMIALDENQAERAAELFTRAILVGPDFEPPYMDLAATLLAMDRPAEALKTLEKRGARFKPTFRGAFISAMASARLNQADAALKYFGEAEGMAKAEQPALLDHRFYFQFGATMERVGKVEEAARYLQKAIELKPEFPEALNHLGYMWADRGENLERALELIRKAVDAEPENEAYLDSLGWVLFKMGKAEEALPWLEKSLKLLEKPDPTIHDHLGDVLAALKRWKEAAEQYRKSLAIEPSEAIQKKLDQVPK
jgi:tetratricopeptide (TPR) repeat protein